MTVRVRVCVRVCVLCNPKLAVGACSPPDVCVLLWNMYIYSSLSKLIITSVGAPVCCPMKGDSVCVSVCFSKVSPVPVVRRVPRTTDALGHEDSMQETGGVFNKPCGQ